VDLSQRSDLTQGVQRSSGAYELVLGAVLFSLIGLVIDRSIGTTPWFTVVLAVLGFAGATASIYYRYQAAMSEYSQQREVS
jgi:F0F1-type ATP synthase assembly protein I